MRRFSRSTVVLEGDRAAVVAIAVGLDDQPLLAPEEVDAVAADPNVRPRARGSRCATAETRETDARARSPCASRDERERVERQAEDLGFADRAAEARPARRSRRMSSSVRCRLRDRDPVASGGLGAAVSDGRRWIRMPVPPGAPSGDRHGDVDRAALGSRMPQSSAALRWLSAAPSPQASVAAFHRPVVAQARRVRPRRPADGCGAAGPAARRRAIALASSPGGDAAGRP